MGNLPAALFQRSRSFQFRFSISPERNRYQSTMKNRKRDEPNNYFIHALPALHGANIPLPTLFVMPAKSLSSRRRGRESIFYELSDFEFLYLNNRLPNLCNL
jgi:hypothetical protein